MVILGTVVGIVHWEFTHLFFSTGDTYTADDQDEGSSVDPEQQQEDTGYQGENQAFGLNI